MPTGMLLALLIFLVTYILISIRRFGRFHIERPAVAMLGAALMILAGVVTPQDALGAIDLNTLALLLGMMLLVASLEICGFFTWLSLRIVEKSKNQFQFLVLIMLATATLSALILNDTVVLLFTPIIIRSCQLIKANPVPFLVAEAVSANIGSVATEVGNPQNAFIAIHSGIPFAEFTMKLLPVTLISMLVAIALIWIVFRRDLLADSSVVEHRRSEAKRWWNVFRGEISKPIDCDAAKGCIHFEHMHRSVWFVLGAIVVVFLGFLISPQIQIPLSLVAFMGGAAVLFALPLLNSEATPKRLMGGVDWSLLLFFVGLFIVLKGVDVSGLMAEMVKAFQTTGLGLTDVTGLSAFTAVLSNLISNVPAVMLLTPLVSVQSSNALWLALAASSTLAGNATILGAAANVIVVETSERLGVEVSFWRFIKAGLPITLVTLLVSIVLLVIIG
ncbi:MAG TPA: SLC13 family permease [Methanomassiliicoccales archaeon]|nr:SLC13 family permease [Methanomassiliicoccales archaeon]